MQFICGFFHIHIQTGNLIFKPIMRKKIYHISKDDLHLEFKIVPAAVCVFYTRYPAGNPAVTGDVTVGILIRLEYTLFIKIVDTHNYRRMYECPYSQDLRSTSSDANQTTKNYDTTTTRIIQSYACFMR